MSLLRTLGNHPALGVLVAALSVVVLLGLELRILALGRPGRVNHVLTLIGLGFAMLSCLSVVGHFIARMHT
jgi:hypothetical protein